VGGNLHKFGAVKSKWGLLILRKVLMSLVFWNTRTNSNWQILMECHIRALRISYLSNIAKYRSKGRLTVYVDETPVSVAHTLWFLVGMTIPSEPYFLWSLEVDCWLYYVLSVTKFSFLMHLNAYSILNPFKLQEIITVTSATEILSSWQRSWFHVPQQCSGNT
jgi:hypothetical protein